MKKFIQILALSLVAINFSCYSTDLNQKEEPLIEALEKEIISFKPPKNWKSVELDKLSPAVKMMLIGTGKENFPPSITLAVEPFSGTLKDYLKIVKNMNIAEKTEWKDLGKIKTGAGSASLSQYDENSNWGVTRTMTTILVKNGNAYILSATALKSEFSGYYKDFFAAMRSLDLKSPSH